MFYHLLLCYRSGGEGNDKTLIPSTYETNKKIPDSTGTFFGFAFSEKPEVPGVPDFFCISVT